jgi:hypothetical protein
VEIGSDTMDLTVHQPEKKKSSAAPASSAQPGAGMSRGDGHR